MHLNSTTKAVSENSSVICSINVKVWLSVFVPVIHFLIFAVGLVGNGLVIWILTKRNRRRSTSNEVRPTNLYLLNLAVADTIFVGFLPLWAVQYFFDQRWMFGVAACKVFSCITLLNLYGSVFFLVAMAFDRFIAVVHPFKAKRFRNQRNATIISTIIWLLALAVSSKSIVLRAVKPTIGCVNLDRCIWDFYDLETLQYVYFAVRTGVGFFIPFFAILFCYFFVFLALRKKKQDGRESMRIIEKKVNNLILWIIGVFVTCWLPNHIITILYAVDISDVDYSVAFPLTACLGYANSCINPILYAFKKDEVRNELLVLISRYFGRAILQTGLREDEDVREATTLTRKETKNATTEARDTVHVANTAFSQIKFDESKPSSASSPRKSRRCQVGLLQPTDLILVTSSAGPTHHKLDDHHKTLL